MMLSNLFSKKQSFYVSKNEYYETITTENAYLKMIASDLQIANDEDCKTESQILFNNKLELNCKYDEIINSLGAPIYQTNKPSTKNHSVLFYKKRIGEYKIRLEIHVVEKKFLIGFITFNLTNIDEKKDILDLLLTKYKVKRKEFYSKDFRIYNDRNEFIKVIDSVDVTLVYGVNSKFKNQIITKIAEEKELKFLSQSQRQKKAVYDNI